MVKGQIQVNLTPQPCAHKQHLTEKKATRGTEYSTEEKNTSATPLCVKLTSLRQKQKQKMGKLEP